MRLLLDTHAVLWWVNDDRRLGVGSRALLQDRANAAYFSIVSLWEIALKVRVGKLRADVDVISNTLGRQGFVMLAITPAHLIAMTTLPDHHGDPFDHLLAAQAIVEGAALLTADRRMPLYPVQCVDCRQ